MAKGVALVGPQAPMRAASRSSRNRMMRVAASTATGLFLVVLAVGYVSQPAGRAELEQQKAAISEKLAGAVIPAMSAGKEQMQARVQSGLDKELAEDARESARETTPDGLFTNVMHQQLVTVANGRTAAEGALEQTVKQGHEFEIHEDEKNLAGKMLAHKVAGVKGVEHRDHEFEEQLKKMKSEAEYRVERERKAKAMLAVAGAVPKGSYGYRKSADASYDKVFQKDLARGGDSADENYAMQEAADEVQAKLKERQFAKEQAQVAARDKAHREALARREAEERAADQRREKAALAREEAAHERSSEELIGARPRAESAQAEAVHAKPQAKAAHAKPQAKEAHGALTEDPQEAYEQSEEAAEVTASREAEKAHNVRAWLAARAEKKKVEASASHLEKERESDIDAIIGAAPLPAAAQDGTHNAPEAAHKAAKNAPKSASAPAKTAKKAEAAGSAHAGAPKKAKAAAKEANKAMATQKIEDSIDEDIREMRHLAK